MTTTASDMLNIALAWYDGGYCVIPAATDGSKRPLGQWKEWQHVRPPRESMLTFFGDGHSGMGLITGAVSGYLEMLEIEGLGMREGIFNGAFEILRDSGLEYLWTQMLSSYMELTPGGGVHFLYRIDGAVGPNTKLARRPANKEELALNPDDKVKVLAETRGEGGFVVIAPSNGTVHPSGKPWRMINGEPGHLVTISQGERDLLHRAFSCLDKMPAIQGLFQRPASPTESSDDAPGADFASKISWREILEPHGWIMIWDHGQRQGWKRPGKTDMGISATTGGDNDVLFVFSTSTVFESERSYTKFGAYAVLNHHGDHSEAAKALRIKGFGSSQSLAGANLSSNLWTVSPMLTHIRDFAFGKGVSPMSVLGVVLTRIATSLPPTIVIPDLVGDEASLNFFLALVGVSGAGKGAAINVGRRCIRLPGDDRMPILPLGSGEGLLKSYAKLVKHPDGVFVTEHHTHQVLFVTPEIDTWFALDARSGSTLTDQLRMAWSGEQLGFTYSDPTKRMIIKEHTYRMGLVIGVQPSRAEFILRLAGGGLPQRIFWTDVRDPNIPRPTPPSPTPISVGEIFKIIPASQFIPGSGNSPLYVEPSIAAAVIDRRLAVARYEREPGLDGHEDLMTLKVAALLNPLIDPEQRVAVTDVSWNWASILVTASTAVRRHIESSLSDEKSLRAKASGEYRAIQEETSENAAMKRTANRIFGILEEHSRGSCKERGYCVLRCFRHMSRDQIGYRGAALALLIGEGRVIEFEGERKDEVRFRLS